MKRRNFLGVFFGLLPAGLVGASVLPSRKPDIGDLKIEPTTDFSGFSNATMKPVNSDILDSVMYKIDPFETPMIKFYKANEVYVWEDNSLDDFDGF